MLRSISSDRIRATRAWEEHRATSPEPPAPWAGATPETLAGTWAWEEERVLSEGKDGTVLSEWVAREWCLDIEQRCWHRLERRLLADGSAPSPGIEPVREEFAGTYDLPAC